VFEKGGGGQDDVGEIGGVGLELFEDDGEEIVAPEAAADGVLIGRDGGRVRVVDDQGLDRRIVNFPSERGPVPTY
jgi:hypothetical protein